MKNPSSEFENLPPVWDRLRERLEQMHAGADQKSNPEARAKKRADRARQVRHQAEAADPTNASVNFLAFAKGRERYGIPLEHVLEVQALEQFSPVPGAPDSIRGVVHWRGTILALLDLTRLFEVSETGLSDLHFFVVVEAARKRLAVAASTVDDILSAHGDDLKTAPKLSRKIAPEWVVGVHDENRLILQMDEIFKHLEQKNER